MGIIAFVRSLVNPPSPQALAIKELESARRALLEAQSEEEYAAAMVSYNQKRVERLSQYIAEFQMNEKPVDVSANTGWAEQMPAMQAAALEQHPAPTSKMSAKKVQDSSGIPYIKHVNAQHER